ncbi:MAG: cell wall hydrolase [Pseudomonadota bacterium]
MFKNILQPVFGKRQKQKKTTSQQDYYKELEVDVLARTIFGEARGEPHEGMEAVANVVLNRARISEKKGRYWWGNGIIGVCQKPYQFSCWNRSDPSYQRLIDVDESNIHFATCLRIARRAVFGLLQDNTKGATHYHADYVDPYWAKGEKPLMKIGAHIFYKLVEA